MRMPFSKKRAKEFQKEIRGKKRKKKKKPYTVINGSVANCAGGS